MRKSGIILGIAASLIVLVVLVVPAFVDINQYRPKIEAELQKALGRQVSVGPMRLSLLPPRARVSNVVIAEDPNYGTGPFISVPEMSASIDVWALLKGEMKLQSLTLKQPSVQLVHTKSGVWNFSSLGGKQSGNKDTQGTGAVPLSNIEISDGHVTLIDQQKNFRGSYEQIDLSVEGYAPNQAFDVDAGMVLPGKGAGKLQLQGKIGPIQPNDIMSTPVNGELKLQEVSIASLQALTNQQQDMALNGTASGKISVRNNGRELESSGEMKVDKLSVRGVQVDYPIALEYKLSGNLNDHNFKVEGGKLSLGPTPFGFSGTLNAAPTPMTVDMSLSTKDAPLAEAARLAAAFGVAFGTQVNVAGQLTADIQARGPVNNLALNGSVVARNISVSGGELKQSVEVPEIQLALTPTAIRSNSFTASSAGTKLQVQFGLTNYTSPAPQVDAQLRTSKAQVGELIAMANAYGVEAAQGMSGSGEASLDVHASGPLKDANAMSFSGSGQLGNVTLHTQSLKQPLKVTRADLKFTQNSVAVQNFAAALGSTNASGNLTLGNFAAPRVQFALNADQFNVTELQQIMASTGQSEPAAWAVVARAEAKKQAEPSILTRMTGQGKVTIGKILYDKLVLTNVRSDVQLDHGIIKLAPLNASLFGGQQTGSITLDTRTNPMGVRMESKLQQVQANDLLSAVSNLKGTIYGLLATNGQASFNTVDSDNIASTLNGKMSLNLSDGKIVGIDLLNRLSNVAKFSTGVQTPGNFTNIARLTGDFNVVNGLAQTSNLRAEISGGSVASDGTVNLVNQTLALHLTAVLSKEMTQRVGGTGVGGFMSTALANNNGELVVPVLITGTMQNPTVKPDVQKMAQMKLQKLLPTSGNPGGLTSGILGAVLGGKQGGQQQGGIGGLVNAITGKGQQQPQGNANQPATQNQQEQQQPKNPLGDALNQIFGGKKKQEQPAK